MKQCDSDGDDDGNWLTLSSLFRHVVVDWIGSGNVTTGRSSHHVWKMKVFAESGRVFVWRFRHVEGRKRRARRKGVIDGVQALEVEYSWSYAASDSMEVGEVTNESSDEAHRMPQLLEM